MWFFWIQHNTHLKRNVSWYPNHIWYPNLSISDCILFPSNGDDGTYSGPWSHSVAMATRESDLTNLWQPGEIVAMAVFGRAPKTKWFRRPNWENIKAKARSICLIFSFRWWNIRMPHQLKHLRHFDALTWWHWWGLARKEVVAILPGDFWFFPKRFLRLRK